MPPPFRPAFSVIRFLSISAVPYSYNTLMSKPADLLAYLFEGRPQLLSEALLGWMQASPRFTAFVKPYASVKRCSVIL
jgi:hypothetical protein